MINSIHKDSDILQIYFCVIFSETRHHAQAHVTSGILCPFFGHENTNSWVDFAGHCLLWLLLLRTAAIVVPLFPQNSLLTSLALAPDSAAVGNQNFNDGFLLKFYLLFSGHCSRPTSSALFRLLCMTAQFQKRNAIQI